METFNKGFYRLDFDEAKRVGAQVGFDVLACARKKKSCGPGADYYSQDKRYFVLTLLKHIEQLQADAAVLPAEVTAWYLKAKDAAREYAQMEESLNPVLAKKK